MTANDILDALPSLSAAERAQIFQRLCQLLDEDLVRGFGPTPDEMRMLAAALAGYARDCDAGDPWRACLDQLNDQQHKRLTAEGGSPDSPSASTGPSGHG